MNTSALLRHKVHFSLVPIGRKVICFTLKVKRPEVECFRGLAPFNLLRVWLVDLWLPLPSVYISSAPVKLRKALRSRNINCCTTRKNSFPSFVSNVAFGSSVVELKNEMTIDILGGSA